MKPIPYGRQYITEEDIEMVAQVLRSDHLTQGPAVELFEKQFAEYVGARYAVAVSNGTAALHLSAMAHDLRPSDKVITTPITFSASANCVRYCGADVVFADIEATSFTIDLNKVEDVFRTQKNVKGVIPVDLAGHAVNLEELRSITSRYGAWIIEDACHAPGGYFRSGDGTNQLCGNGNYADQAIFSFHPVKHIATGEGGMITTNDEKIFRRLLKLRSHGITRDPEMLQKNDGGWYMELQELGYNYRMSDILAILGVSQLKRAEKGLARRKEIAHRYSRELRNSRFELPLYDDGHAFHLYIIQTDNRGELYNYLRTKNIFSQVHYIPVHLMPYYRQMGWKESDFPIAEKYYERCLSIPMFPSLTDEEQSFVISVLQSFKCKG